MHLNLKAACAKARLIMKIDACFPCPHCEARFSSGQDVAVHNFILRDLKSLERALVRCANDYTCEAYAQVQIVF